jgi:hypothetical protein
VHRLHDNETFAVGVDQDGRHPALHMVRDMTPGEVAAIDLLSSETAEREKLARLLQVVAQSHPVFPGRSIARIQAP